MSVPKSDHAAENEQARVIRIVPRSQVWEGSRGRARSYLHLALRQDFAVGRLRRVSGAFLCGRAPGWYEDADARSFTHAARCPRCVSLAERYGIEWPEVAALSTSQSCEEADHG